MHCSAHVTPVAELGFRRRSRFHIMDKFIGTLLAFVIVSVCAALFAHAHKVYANQSKASQKRIVAIVAFSIAVVLTILIIVFIQARSRYGP